MSEEGSFDFANMNLTPQIWFCITPSHLNKSYKNIPIVHHYQSGTN